MRLWGRREVSLLLTGIRHHSGIRGFPEQRLRARLAWSGTTPPPVCPPMEKAKLGLKI